MLIELYAAAIRHVQNGIEAERDQDEVNSCLCRLKAVRVIQGIVAGLDLSQGEVPQNISAPLRLRATSPAGAIPPNVTRTPSAS